MTLSGCATTTIRIPLSDTKEIVYTSGKDQSWRVVMHADGRIDVEVNALASTVIEQQRLVIGTVVESAVAGAVKGASP